MNAPELTVVIPTYNRLDTLRYVVPSLLDQDVDARYELVVGDSNSNDGTADYLAEIAASDPRVRHLPGPYNGRAMARNAGIAAARGEIVLFTDSDIVATRDLLSRHLAIHRARRNVAVVGLELQVDSIAGYEELRAHPERRSPLHPSGRKRLSWLYFMTGNASVRRADLERVGRFDEDFTGYGHEDLELGYRLERAGIEIAYESRAVNYHCQFVPYDEQKSKMALAGRSTVRFARKHPAFVVKARLGMTPLSLLLYDLLRKRPRIVNSLERTAAAKSGLARNIVYQYHYLAGVREALADRG